MISAMPMTRTKDSGKRTLPKIQAMPARRLTKVKASEILKFLLMALVARTFCRWIMLMIVTKVPTTKETKREISPDCVKKKKPTIVSAMPEMSIGRSLLRFSSTRI